MAQDPKVVVQRVIDEVWNRRDAAAAEELIAADVVWHHATLGDRRGREAFLEVVNELRSAFPDTKVSVEPYGLIRAFAWLTTNDSCRSRKSPTTLTNASGRSASRACPAS